jgi:hypothetical protein
MIVRIFLRRCGFALARLHAEVLDTPLFCGPVACNFARPGAGPDGSWTRGLVLHGEAFLWGRCRHCEWRQPSRMLRKPTTLAST